MVPLPCVFDAIRAHRWGRRRDGQLRWRAPSGMDENRRKGRSGERQREWNAVGVPSSCMAAAALPLAASRAIGRSRGCGRRHHHREWRSDPAPTYSTEYRSSTTENSTRDKLRRWSPASRCQATSWCSECGPTGRNRRVGTPQVVDRTRLSSRLPRSRELRRSQHPNRERPCARVDCPAQ